MVRAALAIGLVVVTVCASDQLATATGSRADTCACYPWPIAPFHVPHPVRGVFGDPRTVFLGRAGGDEVMHGRGAFSFHNGIDIDAPNGTAVYPVESGVVAWVKRNYSLLVKAADGRSFTYTHLTTRVTPGQPVTAGSTVLGRVHVTNSHLHFSEISVSGRLVNPLLPNHLTPYVDRTRPVVAAIEAYYRGRTVPPLDLHGTVGLVVNAADRPMPVDGTAFRVTKFARERFGVTPAAITWSLTTLGGLTVIPRHTQVDFRDRLPANRAFWRVFARGTYQNRVWIKSHVHRDMPGKYIFRLVPELSTNTLPNGVYVVCVNVVDTRGNSGSLRTRIEIHNERPPTRRALADR